MILSLHILLNSVVTLVGKTDSLDEVVALMEMRI